MEPDHEFGNKPTRRLFFRLNALALLLPLLLGFAIYIYSISTGIELTKSQIKTIVFAIWLGTMCVLVLVSMFSVFRRQPVKRSLLRAAAKQGAEREVQLNRTSKRWEHKKTNRLLRETVKAFLLIPLIASALLGAYFRLTAHSLSSLEWRVVIAIIWLGTIMALGRVAYNSLLSPIVYRGRREDKPQ